MTGSVDGEETYMYTGTQETGQWKVPSVMVGSPSSVVAGSPSSVVVASPSSSVVGSPSSVVAGSHSSVVVGSPAQVQYWGHNGNMADEANV